MTDTQQDDADDGPDGGGPKAGKKGRRPLRTVRIEDDLWEEVQEAVAWRGDASVSAVIRRSLVSYVAATNRKRRQDQNNDDQEAISA